FSNVTATALPRAVEMFPKQSAIRPGVREPLGIMTMPSSLMSFGFIYQFPPLREIEAVQGYIQPLWRHPPGMVVAVVAAGIAEGTLQHHRQEPSLTTYADRAERPNAQKAPRPWPKD